MDNSIGVSVLGVEKNVGVTHERGIRPKSHRVQAHTKQLSCSKTPHRQIKGRLFNSDGDVILHMNARLILSSHQEEVAKTSSLVYGPILILRMKRTT